MVGTAAEDRDPIGRESVVGLCCQPLVTSGAPRPGICCAVVGQVRKRSVTISCLSPAGRIGVAVVVPEALDGLGGHLVAGVLLAEVVEQAELVAGEDVVVGLGKQLGPHALQLALQEGVNGGVDTGFVVACDVEGLLYLSPLGSSVFDY